MKCPRCVQVIHRGAVPCPHCGFSIADADARFGSGEVSLRLLADVGGLMRSRERGKVEKAQAKFGKLFPQLFFAVHTGGSSETGGNLRQFGFWLLNRAAFEDVPVEKPNEAGILLSIDPEAKSAGVTWGYLLDPFLTEDDTFICLSRAHAYWLEGRYAEGIVRVVEQLSKILAKRSRQAKRDPEKFERKVAPPKRTGEIARRIREGHRPYAGKREEVEK
ncbi:MAG: hypothetical protein JWO82_3955 [Akkermansiaceae bacterium]|nr:hypothetical protein [Akkermansiaceae bacterium]